MRTSHSIETKVIVIVIRDVIRLEGNFHSEFEIQQTPIRFDHSAYNTIQWNRFFDTDRISDVTIFIDGTTSSL